MRCQKKRKTLKTQKNGGQIIGMQLPAVFNTGLISYGLFSLKDYIFSHTGTVEQNPRIISNI